MVPTIPNLAWYTERSGSRSLLPRCPFASVHRCPRFYQSLSLMGEAGSAKIDPEEDKKLNERWQRSDLWPTTREQATSIMGLGDSMFRNFCPEVSFEQFGLFASHLYQYADGRDADIAHAKLSREQATREDWRWTWQSITPLHYSDCPLYSPLAHDSTQRGSPTASNELQAAEIMILKPSVFGMGINLKAAWARFRRWCLTLSN